MQCGIAAALCQQTDRRPGNHNFPDQIDKLIQLVGLNADQLAFLHLVFLGDLLFAQCRIHQLRLHHALFHQNIAKLTDCIGFGGRCFLTRFDAQCLQT